MDKPTEILFFNDTEDYTSNRSCDAILDFANLYAEEGVTAHFALVGYVARQLVQWKRWDVLHALKGHLIGTHTLYHSLHPDICELTDLADYDEAYRLALAQEAEAIGMIKAATGAERIAFAVPPGNCKTYVAMYLYADMGIPFYCDTTVGDAAGSDLWYCNARHIPYVYSFETLLPGHEPVALEDVLDQLAKRERAIVYCHPNMAVHTEFWDSVNYNKGNLSPFGQWKSAPCRGENDTALYYARIRELVRRIKADARFRITTTAELDASRAPRKAIVREDMPALFEALRRSFEPVDQMSLCVADVFQAVVRLLRGEQTHTPGKVYGFLDTPIGVKTDTVVTAEGLRTAAREISLHGFLPESFIVNGERIGPADFLMAGLEALTTDAECVRVSPKPQLISLERLPKLAHGFMNGAWIHTDAFEDKYLSDRLRLQAWTLRKE